MSSFARSGSNDKQELILGFHRGAIDQTTITTQPPPKVMKHVNSILREMGVQVQEESNFHYRCIRAGRNVDLDHAAVSSNFFQSLGREER